MKIKELKNKNIAILGFGLEGKSTLSFLIRLGVKNITILDSNNNYYSKLVSESFKSVKIIFGEKYLDNLGKFDLIIKSPGISPYNSKIIPYKDKLTSQTEIFLDNYKGKVIGITGTKGKSTISSLTYEILKSAGYKTKLVGNIGKPVLDEIDLLSIISSPNPVIPAKAGIYNLNNTLKNSKSSSEGQLFDFIVYELSSYMLEGFSSKLFIGVLNNIFPDHMNWHGNSFNIYKKAKKNIFKNAVHKIDGRKIKVKEKFITKLKGDHNQKNITVVKEICNILKISENIFHQTIKSFTPLKHRIEIIGTYKGITFIDDSISTTPESTIEAIKTFGDNISVIFLGGLDRGYDFKNLVKYLKKYKIENIVLFPDSGFKISKLINKNINVLTTKLMKEAVSFSFLYGKKGSICLLSTASPSYNLWKNYKEKGKNFRKEIEKQANL